jgi:TPR repeat protein
MVIAKDLDQYSQWLKTSAENGWPKAEFAMARSLLNGLAPFPKDEAKGVSWLERAAGHGHLQALDTLGIRLMQGIGVPQNTAEAMKCWRWAAEHGDATAQNDLGYALKTGDAGQADLVEACMWFQMAAKAGNEKARINLANISSILTDEQSREATQRVQDFHAQPLPQLDPVKRDENSGRALVDISSAE